MKLCYPHRHVLPAIKPGRPIRHRPLSASPRTPGGLYAVPWPWLRWDASVIRQLRRYLAVCRVVVGQSVSLTATSTTKALRARRGSDLVAIGRGRDRPDTSGRLEGLASPSPAYSTPFSSRSLHIDTQGKGDACRPLGPAPICALGARGIFFVLAFEKTPQKPHAAPGRHGGGGVNEASARIIMWSSGQLPRSVALAVCGSAEKGLQSRTQACLLGRETT